MTAKGGIIEEDIYKGILKGLKIHNPTQSQQNWYRFCSAQIVSYTAALNIQHHAKILSAMILVESRYQKRAKNGDSEGLGQVRAKYLSGFTHELRKRGKMPVGPISNPVVQIAAAAGAFHVFLVNSGDIAWAAVRMYNGAGWRAKRHRRRVWNAYFKMYGSWP